MTDIHRKLKLSLRLLELANRVLSDQHFADIGSDHALVPLYLICNDIVPTAIAGEVHDGPYLNALSAVAELDKMKRIQVRKGNGLDVITANDEVRSILIAGMGGGLIRDILERGMKQLSGVKRLILQPNVASELVRRWLHENGWLLTEELMIEEERRYYEVLVAEPDIDQRSKYLYQEQQVATVQVDQQLLFLLGPLFIHHVTSSWCAKWTEELFRKERVLAQMQQSNQLDTLEKRIELQHLLQKLKEAISCLCRIKP